jgi:hypothetical protein
MSVVIYRPHQTSKQQCPHQYKACVQKILLPFNFLHADWRCLEAHGLIIGCLRHWGFESTLRKTRTCLDVCSNIAKRIPTTNIRFDEVPTIGKEPETTEPKRAANSEGVFKLAICFANFGGMGSCRVDPNLAGIDVMMYIS